MVKQEDLKGAIEDYPIEIVELMIANQVAQGNPPRVEVFQIKADAAAVVGGFSWSKSKEGPQYWSKVHNGHIFELPKDVLPSKNVVEEELPGPTTKEVIVDNSLVMGCTVLADMSHGKGRVAKKKKLISIIDTVNGPVYICITEDLFNKLINEEYRTGGLSSHKEGITKYHESPKKIKLTLKDVSEGKGVGIPPELIEIVQ